MSDKLATRKVKLRPHEGQARRVDYVGELNPDQLAVVMHPGGPMLVLAGAGSGKTRTVVYRIARLLAAAAFTALAIVGPAAAGAGTAGFTLQLDLLLDPTPHYPQATDSPEPLVRPWAAEKDLFLPSPLGADRPALPARLGQDLAALVRVPFDWDSTDWRRFGVGTLAVGTVALFDEKIDSWLDANRTDGAVRAAKAIRPLGEEVCLAFLGATWLAGRHFDRSDYSAVARDGLEAAIIAAGVITPALKAIAGRARPRSSADADVFGAGGQSFPSGEATMAFAVASVVAAHSEKAWIDVVAWSAATLVGLERLTLDAHWASDLVAGALIGATVGRWVVRRNNPEHPVGPRFDLGPLIDERGVGVAFHMSLP